MKSLQKQQKKFLEWLVDNKTPQEIGRGTYARLQKTVETGKYEHGRKWECNSLNRIIREYEFEFTHRKI